jgi:acetyl esterase/lipase
MSLAVICMMGLSCAIEAVAQEPAEVIELWPSGWLDKPPTVRGPEKVGKNGSATGSVSNISRPRIEIYRPERPNGNAALIVGGGGYFRIQIGTAAKPIAQWLAATGTTAAVLYYRLPGDGWKPEAPFQDGQRAMRILRGRAKDLEFTTDKVGMIGASAGANLSGIIATRWDHPFYAPLDATDALSARPDFLALLYPVVSMKPPLDDSRSSQELSTQPDYLTAYSVEEHVRPDMPPVFLAQAQDDPIVGIGHARTLDQALRKTGVREQYVEFKKGGHSWGMGRPGSEPAQWPHMFLVWARGEGFLKDP